MAIMLLTAACRNLQSGLCCLIQVSTTSEHLLDIGQYLSVAPFKFMHVSIYSNYSVFLSLGLYNLAWTEYRKYQIWLLLRFYPLYLRFGKT
jgi:hypothetical protein